MTNVWINLYPCRLPSLRRVLQIQTMGAVRSFCFHRLMLLEQKYNLHVMMNADKEFLAQKSAPHRDFYNVRKVLPPPTAEVPSWHWMPLPHSHL